MVRKMTEKTKSWLKDNIMGVVLAAMFMGFFIQYQSDRAENIKSHKTLMDNSIKFNSRQMTVCTILINDPDTDPYYREILKEWVKMETRGD
jgi:hypothetical protein